MSSRGRGINKKRHSSQPLESEAKDGRTEQGESWSTVVSGRNRPTFTQNRFGLLNEPHSYPDKSMRSSSIASSTGRGRGRGNPKTASESTHQTGPSRTYTTNQRSTRTYTAHEATNEPAGLGVNTRFVTPEPDGAFRDDFGIEFRTINGHPFKGTITFTEAKYTVFMRILGFESALLYSIRNSFSEVPVVRFKLKQQINMDDLRSMEFFDLERKSANGRTDVIGCRILGISRGMQSVPNYDGVGSDTRWVKIEGTDYTLNNDQIMKWLEQYGEAQSYLSEDIHVDSDSEADKVGNGTYSVKMKLKKDIPQFLPMHGKKIRIYYRNMTKLCTNCFGQHQRRQCRNQKVPWVTYVRDFMSKNEDLDESYYGKWWEIVDTEFPGYFEGNATHDIDSNTYMDTVSTNVHSDANVPARFTDSSVHYSQQNQQHQLREPREQHISRDPRLNRNPPRIPPGPPTQEIEVLMSQGLTLNDAQSYLQKKKELSLIEERMNPSNQQALQQNQASGSAISQLNND